MRIRITPQYIKEAVHKHLEIDLTSKSRKKEYVFGRWLAFKLTRKLTCYVQSNRLYRLQTKL